MQYNKSSNKIILKIQLIGKRKLRISLVYLDPRFRVKRNKGKFLYFKSKVTDLHVYSRGTFRVSKYMIRLPDDENFPNTSPVLIDFDDENDRKEFLEKLYKVLTEWSNFFIDFKEDNLVKVRFNGEFWIF